KATPVEESTGVLDSMFGEGVTATRFVPRSVILGQELVEQHQPVVVQGQYGLRIQL
nr:hypothetical protein [Tanacetum cinerariifolium]